MKSALCLVALALGLQGPSWHGYTPDRFDIFALCALVLAGRELLAWGYARKESP
jgi:hypothetical protein